MNFECLCCFELNIAAVTFDRASLRSPRGIDVSLMLFESIQRVIENGRIAALDFASSWPKFV